MVLPKSEFKPIEKLSFVEHLISGFTWFHEIQENWYPLNNDESTVFII